MAIENRFASEEYVLNQIENNNNNIVLDWSENDSNSNNYIKNRTHYPTETVVFSWDGDESNYEVYEDKYDDNNYIKYIKVSNTVDDSIKEIISNGVCKYSTNGITYESNNKKNTTVDDKQFLYRVHYNLVDLNTFQQNNTYTAEFIAISFLEGESKGYGSNFSVKQARAIFVLQEGLVGGYTGVANLTLPVGVYLTKVCNYGQVYTTKEYSYTKTKKLNESYLTDQGLTWYSKDDGDNLILQSYSTAEGYNNIIQKHINDPSLLLSLDRLGNNIEYEQLATHVEGADNSIFGRYNHGEGQENKLFSTASHIEGHNNVGGLSNRNNLPNFIGSISGKGNHIEGYYNLCGDCDGAHVEGYYNNVQADYGHGEGMQTTVTGTAGHAQNSNTQATGDYSTASGTSSIAKGRSSDAGNIATQANHEGSFTRGYCTASGTEYQAVVGKYNEIFADSFFDVGNGSSEDNRKTAFSVKKDGSAQIQTQGNADSSITRKDYVDTSIATSKEEAIKEVLSMSTVDSWEKIQKIVRSGYASSAFNLGDQLVCNSEQFGELVWDIIGFDQDIPSDSQYTHSMTLQLHNVLDKKVREYDSQEFAFKITEDLGPGDYHLSYVTRFTQTTIPNIGFTIPEETIIPANSYIYRTGTSEISFVSFDLSETFYTAETSSLGATPPEESIYLGEIAYAPGGIGIQGGGSNYYPNSGIRFFLNGENSTLDWVSSHELDRPPSYVNDPGFLYQIDSDFREVLGSVNKLVYNFVEGTVEEISELIFLPSATELYGTPAFNQEGDRVNLGEPYEYYVIGSGLDAPTSNNSITCRIKYDSENIATPYYLRSPYAANPTAAISSAQESKISTVNSKGIIGQSAVNGTGNGARYLAPCCCIV